MIEGKYFDKYGLIRMEINTPTENGILFRAYLDFFRYLNGAREFRFNPVAYTFTDEKDYFQANPPEHGLHFSRDNMLGLYCCVLMRGCPKINMLPAFYWNRKYNWHPNCWAVFLSFRNVFLKFLFTPLIAIMYAHSRIRHRDPTESSGACLWAMTLYFLYGIKPGRWEIDKFVYYITNGYRYVNPDNPILCEIRKYKSAIIES